VLPEDTFVVFIQCYVDESGKFKDHSVISLCGFAGSIRQIETFDGGWKSLLRRNGMSSLTMKKAARFTQPLGSKNKATGLEARTTALLPFIECMRDNMEVAVQVAVDIGAFNSLSTHYHPRLGGEPYYLAFQKLLGELLRHYSQPAEDVRISLVCDEEQHYSIRCYDILARLRAKYKDYKRALVSISFADDEFFTVLQAADVFAYLTRREAQMHFAGGPSYEYGLLYHHLTSANTRGNLAVLGGLYNEAKLRSLAAATVRR
jgi:hypothetical protein